MEGLAALGINVPQLLAQAVNFIILFLLLGVFAFKPIMKMMDERSRKIKESMEQAEQIKQQAVSSEKEFEQKIAEAARQGQDMIARAVQAGEDVRQKAQQQAKVDAETIIARARAEIQQERDAAIDELRRQVTDISIMAAEKVIEAKLDKQQHRQLIDKVLSEAKLLERKN